MYNAEQFATDCQWGPSAQGNPLPSHPNVRGRGGIRLERGEVRRLFASYVPNTGFALVSWIRAFRQRHKGWRPAQGGRRYRYRLGNEERKYAFAWLQGCRNSI